MTNCSFQYSVRTCICTQRAQSFGLKECQLAFTERRTTDVYMKIPPFDSLVWGSLRLAPIIIIIIIYLFSVNTFTPIERCAIIFVIAQVGKLLIGQKIQKLQNCARCNRSLIGQ